MVNKKDGKNNSNTRPRPFFYFSLLFLLALIVIFFAFVGGNKLEVKANGDDFLIRIFESKQEKKKRIQKEIFLKNSQRLAEQGCELLIVDFSENYCDLKKKKPLDCIKNLDFFLPNPICKRYRVEHLKTPEPLRAVYYSAYGASRKDKIEKLIRLAKETEINAVVIDIKETNGQLYLKIPEYGFKEIKLS